MEFKDSETYKNLQKSLQHEALAYLVYQFYLKQLNNKTRKYNDKLNEIIHNEKEHAEIWYKILNQQLNTNKDNIETAIHNEYEEATNMYPNFAVTAEKEGYRDIAFLFRQIAEIEYSHYQEFKEILPEIDLNLFETDKNVAEWKCLNCGHIQEGKKAPEKCPVCQHPQNYFIEI